VARIVSAAEGKMGRDLDRSTALAVRRGGGGQRLLIPKLEDANWAVRKEPCVPCKRAPCKLKKRNDTQKETSAHEANSRQGLGHVVSAR
jgi:hypothetical protein